MMLNTALAIFMPLHLFFIIICNNIANRIVIRYYRKKTPGQQSLVDFFFINFLQFYSLITVTWLAPVYCGFFTFEYIRPYENVAYLSSGIIEVLNLLTLGLDYSTERLKKR